MKSAPLRHLMALSALAVSALAAAPAQAGPYSNVFIFGDSISDSGNVAAALIGQGYGHLLEPAPPNGTHVPGAPYASSGVFSNGPVWATSFASALGVSAAPSLMGGTNYAFGGARTATDGAPSMGGVPFGLTTQLGMFLSASPVYGHNGVAPSDALYVVAGGSNNMRDAAAAFASTVDPFAQIAIVSAAVSSFATDIGGIVDGLQAAGAQHIVVWNIPDIGLTPAAAGFGPMGPTVSTFLADTMNDALAYRLQGEAGVTLFDAFGGLQSLVAGSPGNGFLNVTQASGFADNGIDPATSLFWDGIHPTAHAHEHLAGLMFAAVVPEPETVWLFAFGLAGLLAWSRRRAA